MVQVEVRAKREDSIRGEGIYGKLPLLSGTNDTQVLLKCVLQLLSEMYVRGERYKKAGVVLSGLSTDDISQGDLFTESGPDRNILMETIDQITDKFGGEAIQLRHIIGSKPRVSRFTACRLTAKKMLGSKP